MISKWYTNKYTNQIIKVKILYIRKIIIKSFIRKIIFFGVT